MKGVADFGATMACLALLATPACTSWPQRPAVSALAQAQAAIPGAGDVRRWSDAPAADWGRWRSKMEADRVRSGRTKPPALLALSSGSDKGAFGAGYLAGWTARGDRPSFDVVTGVSTGALIAPFAFLGPDQDATLRAIYTGIEARDIYRLRPLRGLTGDPSFADDKPLARLIARYFTQALLDRIGQEHQQGRRLLISPSLLPRS
ncbi:patatin-like phospholipase family protein [Sphingomonas hankookensis]